MKKFLALILAFVLLFTMTACEEEDSGSGKKKKPSSTKGSTTGTSQGIAGSKDPLLTTDVAVTVGQRKLSSAEMTYFYVDAVGKYEQEIYEMYYSSLGNYWFMMLGFEVNKPLNEQMYDDNRTWADYFIEAAIDTAHETYAIYEDVVATGYKLSDDAQAEMDADFADLQTYASLNGYDTVESYLQSYYGASATQDSYKAYYKTCTLTDNYRKTYKDSLHYNADDYRAYEKGQHNKYSAVNFACFTLDYSNYLGEGVWEEDSLEMVWTEEQKAAARAAMQADYNKLMSNTFHTKEDMDRAIASLGTYGNVSIEGTLTHNSQLNLPEVTLHWLRNNLAVIGDVRVEATEDSITLVMYLGKDDQTYKMANVRHILVMFEEDATGIYKDTAKVKAKEEAERLLQLWKDGKANEDSFAQLANTYSDDRGGEVTNGGLYENIYKGQMVENFENWCFDESRKQGDTGIVETEYGYHVMYFSSWSEQSYRDLLIDQDMRAEAEGNWIASLKEKAALNIMDLSKIDYSRAIG